MYKTLSLVVAAAFLLSAAPAMHAAEETSYADRNLAWLLETYPELEQFPQEALDEIVERSERVDLAAVTAGADNSGTHVGDIWVLGTAAGCPDDNVLAPGTGQFVPVDGQLWLYPDDVQQLTVTGSLSVIGWTDKTSGFYGTVDMVGPNDNFCFEFFGIGFYFAFMNGVAMGR